MSLDAGQWHCTCHYFRVGICVHLLGPPEDLRRDAAGRGPGLDLRASGARHRLTAIVVGHGSQATTDARRPGREPDPGDLSPARPRRVDGDRGALAVGIRADDREDGTSADRASATRMPSPRRRRTRARRASYRSARRATRTRRRRSRSGRRRSPRRRRPAPSPEIDRLPTRSARVAPALERLLVPRVDDDDAGRVAAGPGQDGEARRRPRPVGRPRPDRPSPGRWPHRSRLRRPRAETDRWPRSRRRRTRRATRRRTGSRTTTARRGVARSIAGVDELRPGRPAVGLDRRRQVGATVARSWRGSDRRHRSRPGRHRDRARSATCRLLLRRSRSRGPIAPGRPDSRATRPVRAAGLLLGVRPGLRAIVATAVVVALSIGVGSASDRGGPVGAVAGPRQPTAIVVMAAATAMTRPAWRPGRRQRRRCSSQDVTAEQRTVARVDRPPPGRGSTRRARHASGP